MAAGWRYKVRVMADSGRSLEADTWESAGWSLALKMCQCGLKRDVVAEHSLCQSWVYAHTHNWLLWGNC